MSRLNNVADEKVSEIDAEGVRVTLSPISDDLQEKYSDLPHVESDMTQNLEVFKPKEVVQAPALPFLVPSMPINGDDFFALYKGNDLAVYSVGDHAFGKPSKISARVSLGRG